MKNVIRTLLFAAFAFAATTVNAQDSWSLERCVKHALDNNLTIKQTQANVRTALLSEQQAKASRLPNLSAQVSAGEQFGRTIDPTTNTFGTSAIGFNQMTLSAGVSVFQGGLIHNSVKQAGYNTRAAVADAQQSANDLALQVAQAFLSVLLAEEQLKSAQARIGQSKEQLNNTLKLIDAGNLPPADRFTIDAQIAREEQLAVTSANNVELSMLNLKQLLQLEPDYVMSIEKPIFSIPADAAPEAYTLPSVYETATATQPSISAAGFRLKSAEKGVDIARAGYYPTLSLFANLSSNYSTAFRTGTPGPNELVEQDVQIGGQTVRIGFFQPTLIIKDVPYFDQIDRNFGQGIGVSLNIPIYQNGRTRLSVERARLGIVNAQLAEVQAKQRLKNDIQTAIANAKAAKKQMEAANKSVEAARAAFVNAEKRHALGAINTLNLSIAKNTLDIAENDLLVARYDYLFRLKIIDFYLGKEIKL